MVAMDENAEIEADAKIQGDAEIEADDEIEADAEIEARREQLRKRIGGLNSNNQLQAELRYDEVAPLLLYLDPDVVEYILKTLEDNWYLVDDPTGWVKSCATRGG